MSLVTSCRTPHADPARDRRGRPVGSAAHRAPVGWSTPATQVDEAYGHALVLLPPVLTLVDAAVLHALAVPGSGVPTTLTLALFAVTAAVAWTAAGALVPPTVRHQVRLTATALAASLVLVAVVLLAWSPTAGPFTVAVWLAVPVLTVVGVLALPRLGYQLAQQLR